MNLTITTSSYNDRRYSKPWIAKVDFSSNKQGDFKFGDWVGSAGDKGVLELEVSPGDVVAQGQKDFRKPKNSTPEFYIVESGGSLRAVSKVDAYLHFKSLIKV